MEPASRAAGSATLRSFIMPYDLFHGGIPGGDDCPPAGVPGGCGHLVVGTTACGRRFTVGMLHWVLETGM